MSTSDSGKSHDLLLETLESVDRAILAVDAERRRSSAESGDNIGLQGTRQEAQRQSVMDSSAPSTPRSKAAQQDGGRHGDFILSAPGTPEQFEKGPIRGPSTPSSVSLLIKTEKLLPETTSTLSPLPKDVLISPRTNNLVLTALDTAGQFASPSLSPRSVAGSEAPIFGALEKKLASAVPERKWGWGKKLIASISILTVGAVGGLIVSSSTSELVSKIRTRRKARELVKARQAQLARKRAMALTRVVELPQLFTPDLAFSFNY